jgi:hypothetical protein
MKMKMIKRLMLDAFFLGSLFLLATGTAFSQPAPDKAEEKKQEQRMLDYLEDVREKINVPANTFAWDAKLKQLNSLLATTKDPSEKLNLEFRKAQVLLEAGKEQEAVNLLNAISKVIGNSPQGRKIVLPALGLAYMRLAERTNCVKYHSAEACIMPLMGGGIHKEKQPAEKAISILEAALKEDPTDLDSRWLLNIAYMVTDGYPAKVPKSWLIPGLSAPSKVAVNPFQDIAIGLKLDLRSRAGGMIVDDFNNDGNLDIMCSAWGLDDPMAYYKNNGDGTFTDLSKVSGINRFKGGLNITQADYNNDGWIDFFILRGGWQGDVSVMEQPNSLIRNNGDGTFTDVTYLSGMFSEHPTQTATWNDFNNDGWLDLFIGNETSIPSKPHPCELFINNKNGTFTNVAPLMGLEISLFVKGVASGDYDNDGWAVFLSTLGGQKLLLRNESGNGKGLSFSNATDIAGFKGFTNRTFPTWFFDYNNDGFLDIFMCSYEFDRALSYYSAKEALNPSADREGKPILFLNNGNGTFTDISSTLDMNQTAFAMGANFGDIDNDGWLDFYLATGNPSYKSIIPNKLFKNMNGQRFADVTNTARVGHLQKGHGVSFADINNNGVQDLVVEIGGAYLGDAFQNALFYNPGQNNNNWIGVKLEGTKTNKQGVGAKITLTITENGKQRIIYRELNSGGSFGCSPLRQSIGIGTAAVIDELKIVWPVSGTTQTFKNVAPNKFVKITEEKLEMEVLDVKPIQFKIPKEEKMGGHMH